MNTQIRLYFGFTGQRLKEATELQSFLRSTEDELTWTKEVERLLSTEDIGKDLQSVRFLIKKHQVRRRRGVGKGVYSWQL